jgi:S-disulfanyl-L-cysteine oxidoreductase SoxD
MYTRDLVCVALALAVGGCVSTGLTPSPMESPNLGREATPAQIAGWDISVGPDGVGLPPGKGTPATGATVYEQKCQVCHGTKGAGQPNDRLVGGQGTLVSKAPVRTIGSYWPYATTLWDYIRRAMPFDHPGTLTTEEIYGTTAYLLFLNGIVGERDVIDQTTLPKVAMPNRNGFTADPRPDIEGPAPEKSGRAIKKTY